MVFDWKSGCFGLLGVVLIVGFILVAGFVAAAAVVTASLSAIGAIVLAALFVFTRERFNVIFHALPLGVPLGGGVALLSVPVTGVLMKHFPGMKLTFVGAVVLLSVFLICGFVVPRIAHKMPID